MKRVDAILCADLHLRDTQPLCRTDDYLAAQEKKIKFIHNLQKEHDCSVLCGGDVFHKAKSSQYLEGWAIRYLPLKFISTCGQHDLPNHNIEKVKYSSFGVMKAAKIINNEISPVEDISIQFFNYGQFLENLEIKFPERRMKNIALVHTFIQKPNDKQDKIIGGASALAVMKKLKDFDLIVSGDNHKTFTVKRNGQLLVNPGSMIRMTAGQTEHKPCIFLWNAEANEVEPVYLPIEEGVIDRSHIEIEKIKDDRIKAFVERLNEEYEIGLNFQQNLKNYFNKNKTRKSVQEIVWESFDE